VPSDCFCPTWLDVPAPEAGAAEDAELGWIVVLEEQPQTAISAVNPMRSNNDLLFVTTKRHPLRCETIDAIDDFASGKDRQANQFDIGSFSGFI